MTTKHKTVSEVLREAIERDERTVYEIAKLSNVTQSMIWRFIRDGLDLRLSTADKLCETLGVYLKPRQKRQRK